MHRHAGKDWDSQALCELCRLEREAQDLRQMIRDKDEAIVSLRETIREKELLELEAAAEADEYRSALQDARAVIQKAVDAAQSLAPFVLAHSKWST